MAELASRDGRPPPADLPDGEFICTSLPDGSIRIDQADPRILISGELLDIIVMCPGPYVEVNTAGCMPPPWRATYVGAVLGIHAVNRTVIYRITEFVPRIYGYIGEWPD